MALAILNDPLEADEAVAVALYHVVSNPTVPEDFSRYFLATVRCEASHLIRNPVRRPNSQCAEPSVDLTDFLETEVLKSEIRKAIKVLPSAERDAIELHYLEERTISETAAAGAFAFADLAHDGSQFS